MVLTNLNSFKGLFNDFLRESFLKLIKDFYVFHSRLNRFVYYAYAYFLSILFINYPDILFIVL